MHKSGLVLHGNHFLFWRQQRLHLTACTITEWIFCALSPYATQTQFITGYKKAFLTELWPGVQPTVFTVGLINVTSYTLDISHLEARLLTTVSVPFAATWLVLYKKQFTWTAALRVLYNPIFKCKESRASTKLQGNEKDIHELIFFVLQLQKKWAF